MSDIAIRVDNLSKRYRIGQAIDQSNLGRGFLQRGFRDIRKDSQQGSSVCRIDIGKSRGTSPYKKKLGENGPEVFTTKTGTQVKFDSIEWSNNLDLDPELLYQKSVKLNKK